MSTQAKTEIFIIALITALAVFFRFYQLDQLPPGFQFDQAFYIFDVLRLLQGEFFIFFAAPGGAEPFFPYLAMPAVSIFGADVSLGLKITGAILGALTIPLLYGFARALFHSRFFAALAAFFAAISFWHIFFNRYGERVTLLTLIAILVFWFFWLALEKRMPKYFALTGVLLALALYTYPGARVIPLALAFIALYAILTDHQHARIYARGLLIAAITCALIILPLAYYFFQYPDQFFAHAADVSIFVPHGDVPPDIATALTNNALKILGMFFIAGDIGALRNLPGRPVFDPLSAIFFSVGIIAWFIALVSPRSSADARRRAFFIGAWLAAILSLSLFSDDAPNFARTLPALPVVMLFPAWGALEIWKVFHRRDAENTENKFISWRPIRGVYTERSERTQGMLGGAIIFSLTLLAGVWNSYRDYFVTFANDPDTYYTFDADKVEIARWLNSQSPHHQIFLAPLLSTNGTISLLTRDAHLKSFDSRDTIVLPSNGAGADAVFVFPWEQDKRVQTMLARLSGIGVREDVTGSNGGKLLLTVRVPVTFLPDSQNPLSQLVRVDAFLAPQKIERANWNDSIELLGYALDADDPARRNLVVTLYFHAAAKINRDYSFSLKARDSFDRVWGQDDKWLGDNSYATTHWDAGDVIVEKFYPGLAACAPAGDYRLTVEVYDPITIRALPLLDRDGNIVELGATRVGAFQGVAQQC